MYDELVKRLHLYSENCVAYKLDADFASAVQEAADAIEGLSHAVDQMTEWRKSRWIPVDERLPIGGDDSGAICENVCLLMDDGTVSCGWMNGITKKVYYLNAIDDVVIRAPITRVTHWMPLPEPPTAEEGE